MDGQGIVREWTGTGNDPWMVREWSFRIPSQGWDPCPFRDHSLTIPGKVSNPCFPAFSQVSHPLPAARGHPSVPNPLRAGKAPAAPALNSSLPAPEGNLSLHPGASPHPSQDFRNANPSGTWGAGNRSFPEPWQGFMEPGRDRSRLYQRCHSDAFPQFPLPSGNAPALSSTADAGGKSSAVARAGMIYLGIKPVRVPWSLLRGMASAAEIDLFTAATGSGGCSRENSSQTQAGIFQPLPVILEQPREGADPTAQPPNYQGDKKNPEVFQILEVWGLSGASRVLGIFQGDSGLLFRGDSRLQALIAIFGVG